jgi:hypothetical protein
MEVELVPAGKVGALIREGRLDNAHHVAAVLLCASRLSLRGF